MGNLNKKHIYGILILLLIISFFLDKTIVRFITQIRSAFLDSLFYWVINIENAFVIFFIVLFLSNGLLFIENKKELILYLSAALIGALLICFGLKYLIARQRPAIAVISKLSPSFPSGHATLLFAPLAFLERYKYLWLAIALFIALSRLYLGVHYLSDIMGGILLGLGAGELVMHLKK